MKTVKLGDLSIEWRRGAGLRKSDIVKNGKNSCVLYGELFTKHKNVLIDSSKLSKTNNSGSVASKTGDILVPGTSTAAKQDMILARELDRDGIFIGGDINIIRPKEGLFAQKYLAYYFDSVSAYRQLERYITGTTGIIHISNLSIKNLEIALPPLEEQRKIVEKLDRAFKKIDRAIELTQKNLQNSKDMMNSTLTRLFNGLQCENKKVAEISTNLDSKRIPITKSKRKKGDVPYYGASGIVDYVEDYIFDDDLLLISEDGANLLARSTPIAFSISGKTWVNNHAHVLKFESDTTRMFVEYYFAQLDIARFVTGAAQPKLSQSNLNKIEIPLPSPPIQTRIVSVLKDTHEKTEKLQSHYKMKLAKLEELKRSMLERAFREGPGV